jgi:hypothetical protein
MKRGKKKDTNVKERRKTKDKEGIKVERVK